MYSGRALQIMHISRREITLERESIERKQVRITVLWRVLSTHTSGEACCCCCCCSILALLFRLSAIDLWVTRTKTAHYLPAASVSTQGCAAVGILVEINVYEVYVL